MKNRMPHPANGFTLAEVLVCLLLISILTTGAFKAFHLVQSRANASLQGFRQLDTNQIQTRLDQLRLIWPDISAGNDFTELDCLLDPVPECGT